MVRASSGSLAGNTPSSNKPHMRLNASSVCQRKAGGASFWPAAQQGQQIHGPSLVILQRHVLPVQPDDKVSALLARRVQTSPMGIAAVARHDIAGQEAKAGQAFPARAVGQFDRIDGQGAEVESEMDAPIRARAAGAADAGGIHKAETQVAGLRLGRDGPPS